MFWLLFKITDYLQHLSKKKKKKKKKKKLEEITVMTNMGSLQRTLYKSIQNEKLQS